METSVTRKGLVAGLALLAVLAVGFYFRVDDLVVWRSSPEEYFYQGSPVLLTLDGYHYLGLARDLCEGTYRVTNENHTLSHGRTRPWPPPLLSTLTALLGATLPYSLEKIAVVLSPCLGVLLALPVYALGNVLGGRVLGVTAALVALLSRQYVRRSMIAWYDTDVLNVTLVTGITYVFLRFAIGTDRRRYYYLFSGLLLYAMTLWWWNMAPIVVTFSALLPAITSLFFLDRFRSKQTLIGLIVISLAIVVLLLAMGLSRIADIGQQILLVTHSTTPQFPDLSSEIVELRRVPWSALVANSTGSMLGFVGAWVGLSLLVWRQGNRCLFLFNLLVLSFLSVYAQRFLIFFAPLSGLGVGSLVHELWSGRRRHIIFAVAAPLLLLGILTSNVGRLLEDNQIRPVRFPYHFSAWQHLQQQTPESAVVWTFWGHGYPLAYTSRREVIFDGHGDNLSGKHLLVNSLPLAQSNFRLAANWMQFYVHHGMKGIDSFYELTGRDWSRCFDLLQSTLAVGPEQAESILENETGISPVEVDRWLRFLFPEENLPIYLYLDAQKIRTSWFYYGTWNFEERAGRRYIYQPFYDLKHHGAQFENDRLFVDLESGQVRLDGRTHALRQWNHIDSQNQDKGSQRISNKSYPRRQGLVLETIRHSRFGVLMTLDISRSVGNKLFVRGVFDSRYFQSLTLQRPFSLYQIWRVGGDTYP